MLSSEARVRDARACMTGMGFDVSAYDVSTQSDRFMERCATSHHWVKHDLAF